MENENKGDGLIVALATIAVISFIAFWFYIDYQLSLS